VSCIVDSVFEQSLVNGSSANTAYCIAEILVGANFRIRPLQEISYFYFHMRPPNAIPPCFSCVYFTIFTRTSDNGR